MLSQDVERARSGVVEAEIELAALQERIDAGIGRQSDYEQLPQLKQRIAAAQQAALAAENRLHQSQLSEREKEFRARLDKVLLKMGTHIPEALFAALELRDLELEFASGVPITGARSWEELTALPIGFADALQRSIAQLAPNTEWQFVCAALGEAPRPPELKKNADGISMAFRNPLPTVPPGRSGRVNADGTVEVFG